MASPFASDFVDRVRSAVDLVALVSESVPLKRAGRRFRGLCPFHPEKTPSFHVDDTKGLFYCFGCQAGGDAFKFVMLRENVEFMEAARLLARKVGVPVPASGIGRGRPSEKEALLAVHRAAADFYHKVLTTRPEAAPARKYVKERGISDETIARLTIGFAPDRWDALKTELVGRGISTSLLVTGGLLSQSEGRSGTYDRFRNRIIFPIRSTAKDVVGLGGRILGAGEPKYLNSAESPIYNKREHLFGLDQTREGIRDAGEAVVVEGYFDFASLLQADIDNVVATLGTAFAEEQAALLRRFTQRAVINYDPDAAGAAATRRGVELLLQQGFRVRVLQLEPGADPDEFVRRHGPDAYRSRLASAPRYFEWLLERAVAGRDLSDHEAKSDALKELLPVLARVPDRIERAGCTNLLAQRLGIDDEVTLTEIREALLKAPRPRVPARVPSATPKLMEAEGRLVRALMESAGIRSELLAGLSVEDLVGSPVEPIVRAIEGLLHEGVEATYAQLSEILEEPARSLLASVAMRPEPLVTTDEAHRCVESIRLRRLKREREKLQREMEGESETARLEELMRRKVELSRQIDSLS